jgi:hypothetical protein
MQTQPTEPAHLPPLSQQDKDSLLLYFSLREEPAPTAEAAGLHYADILAWSSRPDIAAYIDQHRANLTRLHRDSALSYLDHIMRSTRDETIRCRAAIGILRATDPARFKSRRAHTADSQPARTKSQAGAAPAAHHATAQNGHIAATSLPESSTNPSTNPQPRQGEEPPRAEDSATAHTHPLPLEDREHDPDHPDDDPPAPPRSPKPRTTPATEPDAELDTLDPAHAARPGTETPEHDFDETDVDPDQDLDDDLDDDLDEDLDDDDWDDDDDIEASRPDSSRRNQSPALHALKPPTAANPDPPEPIPRTIPPPSLQASRSAA